MGWQWAKVIKEEIAALQENSVRQVDKRAASQLERLTMRLVICGKEQVLGVDYSFTFAGVIDLSTVKVILKISQAFATARPGAITLFEQKRY